VQSQGLNATTEERLCLRTSLHLFNKPCVTGIYFDWWVIGCQASRSYLFKQIKKLNVSLSRTYGARFLPFLFFFDFSL